MSINEMSLNEKLERAKSSSNLDELKKLVSETSMIVRRAIARNTNISSDIANSLAFDPVLNVSYMAVKNPKCTITRSFEEKNLINCVTCEKDERHIDCVNCESKKKFR